MEIARTRTATHRNRFNPFIENEGDNEATLQRLDALLAVNAESVREKTLFRSEREKIEASLMVNPLSDRQAFAYFGLLLGIFPPAAIFFRFFTDGNFRGDDFWFLGVVAVVNLISAVVGFFSGKFIGKVTGELEKTTWTKMLLALPFVGILWGILAGGAGGVVVFVIGAVFGGMFGAAVGGVALPAFTIFHRLLKKGNFVDRKHFLPLAFGITLIICAFILGL